MLKKIFFISISVSGLAALFIATLAYWLIAVRPGDEISHENLKKVLAVESPVYYLDGRNKVGVFFQDAHRQYLRYQQIPNEFVQAIVAAEDHDFFRHHGVDFLGIARAMFANLRAGKVVQGGSTLTQQAAKNLFKRKERSVAEKLKELLFAWRLEYHYSKEKILEFYVNQFYVSGNGRGLGVAAKYYFDKPAPELTVLESAFIAGSVKRPNYYNPFIKRDEAQALAARQRAKTRTQYVLNQMFSLGMITSIEYQQNLNRDIPFKKGQMSYALNTIMDLVKEALAEPEVEEALVTHGIENVATSGIRIFTTVEKKMQDYALSSMRGELSRLSTRLLGYDHKQLQARYSKLAAGNGGEVEAGDFLFGRVLAVNDGDTPTIDVALGKTRHNGVSAELSGVIDAQGLMKMVSSLVKYNGQRWSEPQPSDMDALLSEISPGDLVYVSLRSLDSSGVLLDLEKTPEVQGGLIALQEGSIRGMVGGSENRFFNRAIDARRLMGSVAKPLLYTAAIQLGWNAADLLKNERDAFIYQNQVYVPRPDHISPFHWVSMTWAGAKSENVASVWLLYNLCKRLSPAQFEDLLIHVGLSRGKSESYQHYRSRIRDEFGVVINSAALRQLAFAKAVEIIGPDLLFAGKVEEHELLNRFHYRLEMYVDHEDTSYEAEIHRQIMKRSFVTQQALYHKLQAYKIKTAEEGFSGEVSLPQIFVLDGRYAFAQEPPGDKWRPVGRTEVSGIIKEMSGGEAAFWDGILLDDQLTAETVSQLSVIVDQEYERLKALPSYGPDVLRHSRDFRVLASLEYLIGLCKEMGIKSNLEPVLSFPLGSNVITPLEMARAYETVVSGNSYRVGRDGAGESLMIIDRIEGVDGEVLYRPRHRSKRVVGAETSLAVSEILRKVVRYGTGRYAGKIRMHSRDSVQEQLLYDLDLQVPVIGKTGTANHFRNSAFAGYVPGVAVGQNGLALNGGYALAVYEGFDDNISMVRSSTHITGSSGALRLWTQLAEFVVTDHHYADQMDIEDLSFSAEREVPLVSVELGQIKVTESDEVISSLVADEPDVGGSDKVKIGPDVVTFGKLRADGKFKPARYFRPFWEE